jgi:AmiR/NasT family two-component response regulator
LATLTPDEDTKFTDLEECQDTVDHLRAALRTRPVIDQARGILIAAHGCTPEEAFAMLAEASQRDNRKLRDVAAAVVENAQQD